MKESNLEQIKKKYESLRKKYGLPSFNKLNEEFEIEKVQEKETDFLLREIRRATTEKIAAFLHFFELFLNPVTAPLFVLVSLKELTASDKELIESIYRQLVNIELTSIALDMAYNEKKEAQFIKQITEKWQELKTELQEFSALLLKIQTKQKEKRSYLG